MKPRRLSWPFYWVAVVLLTVLNLKAQPRFDDPGFIQLTTEQASQFLSDFRSSRLNHDLSLEFNVVHQPRKGENSAPVHGWLWAGWTRQGCLLRVEIPAHGANARLAFIASKSPAATKLWIAQGNEAAQQISGHTLTQTLAPNLLITPFDLALPFTEWSNTRYTSTERSRGRPVHFYIASNPVAEEPASVEFGLDRVYGALVTATCRNPKGEAIRLLQIEEFSKLEDQWLVGSCSVRQESTRDVDVIHFTAANLEAKHPNTLFDPATLSHATPAPNNLKPL